MTQTAELTDVRSGCAIQWLHSLDEIRAIEGEWESLVSRVEWPSAFSGFDWAVTWWEHFGAGAKLAVLTVRDADGELIGIAPFYIARTLRSVGLRRLGFIGDRSVGSDYLRVIADRERWQGVASAVAGALTQKRPAWDYVEFRDSACDDVNGAIAGLLEDRVRGVSFAEGATCRYIPLPQSFEEYLSSISCNLRGNFRRRVRNLKKNRDVRFECLVDGEAFAESYETLVHLHANRFLRRAEASAFTGNGEVESFHRDVSRRLAARGVARLFRLNVDGATVGALYGFHLGSRFQFFQCGMHPEWMEHGVGQITVGLSIQGAIEMG
ncbi:MAG: GNAT family N-acetyltransferase, partial [Acidobacteriota bacterium]|nr:GNAT family N-acetyltransferase [Acidobacteriota bacterium]